MTAAPTQPGRWTEGTLPSNVRLGEGTVLTGDHVFRRFRSKLSSAVQVGSNTTLDGVHFALGEEARVQIGDFCHLSSVMLLCELEIQIGSYVAIGWNAAIADTDFHPIAPAQRQQDAIACSPHPGTLKRPPVVRKPVVIEDDVWIGPCVTILKGVRIGAGSVIEPGALIAKDVPPRTRVMGNPAQVIGEV